MLKKPGLAQIAHTEALVQVIKARVDENNGWIGFEAFMELALYAPGLGYYSAGATKFGESGDFITAPLMGNQFAGCIARQCIEIFENLPVDDPTTIIEFGAGTGQLALDLLVYLDIHHRFPDRYLVVETSADMKQRQQALIESTHPEYLAAMEWLNIIPEQSISGVVIANELLDAFPVMRFEVDDEGTARELGVTVSDGQFTWEVSSQQISQQFQERLTDYSLPSGYRGEINRRAEAWIRTVGDKLGSGVMLLVDYGYPRDEYYHRDRTQGTLKCHYQHQSHNDPFFYPGIQDITTHVDFSAVAAAASHAGLDVAGYCSQGGFLLSMGLLENFEKKRESDIPATDTVSLSQEVKKLTLPHEMGEIFKVIALSKNHPYPLSGFTMQNHSGRL
jgi:SAM-dependent MidA family methyltransferase